MASGHPTIGSNGAYLHRSQGAWPSRWATGPGTPPMPWWWEVPENATCKASPPGWCRVAGQRPDLREKVDQSGHRSGPEGAASQSSHMRNFGKAHGEEDTGGVSATPDQGERSLRFEDHPGGLRPPDCMLRNHQCIYIYNSATHKRRRFRPIPPAGWRCTPVARRCTTLPTSATCAAIHYGGCAGEVPAL